MAKVENIVPITPVKFICHCSSKNSIFYIIVQLSSYSKVYTGGGCKEQRNQKKQDWKWILFQKPTNQKVKSWWDEGGREREKSREALSNRLVMKGDARGHHFFQLQKSH